MQTTELYTIHVGVNLWINRWYKTFLFYTMNNNQFLVNLCRLEWLSPIIRISFSTRLNSTMLSSNSNRCLQFVRCFHQFRVQNNLPSTCKHRIFSFRKIEVLPKPLRKYISNSIQRRQFLEHSKYKIIVNLCNL